MTVTPSTSRAHRKLGSCCLKLAFSRLFCSVRYVSGGLAGESQADDQVDVRGADVGARAGGEWPTRYGGQGRRPGRSARSKGRRRRAG